MSDFVRLEKRGIVSYRWDGDTREYVQDTDSSRGQIVNLRSRCEIEEGVTLGDIFRAVEADPLLMDFIAQYSWCWAIDDFHEEAKLPKPENIDTKIIEIVIEAFAELHSDRKKPEAPLDFNGVWLHFTGVGEDGVHYSISYTPMNELADVPVRLTNTCEFRKDFTEEPFGKATEYCFSLLDVLDAIYFDISFHGSPQDNREFIEMLAGRMKEVEDGTAKLVEMKFDEEGNIKWDDIESDSAPVE